MVTKDLPLQNIYLHPEMHPSQDQICPHLDLATVLSSCPMAKLCYSEVIHMKTSKVPSYSTQSQRHLTNHCHQCYMVEAALVVPRSTVHCMTTEKLSLQWEDIGKPQLKFWTSANPTPTGQKVIMYRF